MAIGTQLTTREAILTSAAELFGSKGYHGASMRDLAQAVGLEPASLYGHFKSKDDILNDLALHCADDFKNTLTPIYSSQLNTKSKLKEMIVAHVQVTIRNLTAAPVFNHEWKHLEDERRNVYSNLRDGYEGMFREVIRQGIEEHLFKVMDEKFGALTLLSALNFMPQWYRPDGDKSPKELGELLADTLISGILKNF